MYFGQKAIRNSLMEKVKAVAADERASAELKAAADKFFETAEDGAANGEATAALVAELEKAAAAGCPVSKEILDK